MEAIERKEEVRYSEVEAIAKNHNITYEDAYNIYIEMDAALKRKNAENVHGIELEKKFHIDHPEQAPSNVPSMNRNVGMVPDEPKKKKKQTGARL